MAISNTIAYKVTKASKSSRSRLVGIITTRGTGNNDDLNTPKEGDPRYANVGMLGQVWVKVSTESGNINPGDALTASHTPGVGMKATTPGRIVGIALEPYDGTQSLPQDPQAPQIDLAQGVGLILARVQVGWHDPQAEVNIAAESLNSILSYPDSQIDSFANFETTDGEISSKPTLADLDKLLSKISTLDQKVSTLSAKINDVTEPLTVASPEATNIDIAGQQGLEISGSASISGELQVRGSGLVQKILEILTSLTTKNLIISNLAEFLDSVFIRGDVQILGRATFNSDSAGKAIIKKDDQEAIVIFAKEYENVPIINASMAFDEIKLPDGSIEDPKIREKRIFAENYSYLVTDRSTKGFTIILNKPAKEDISFSWVAFAIQGKERLEMSTSEAWLTPTATPEATLIPTLNLTIEATPTPQLTSAP
ncbi:hypothetical protein HY357_00035 [Candidatus Roizmanbacteria bacterium]|nr:hypothetical protein [Candidatus Roizmanbacteria bacterium]